MATIPPNLFISYSHDSSDHVKRVLALSERLRQDGINAQIDQYEQDPEEGWPSWMRKHIAGAEKVLVVFTETYKRRFEGNEETGHGLGATFEGVIVTQALYEGGSRNKKFRALVLDRNDAQFISPELGRFNWYSVDSPENYLRLLRWLKDSPAIIPGPIGTGPELLPVQPPDLFASEPIETAREKSVQIVDGNEVPNERESQQPIKYKALFLEAFGGYQTIATGINDSDQVVGYGQLVGGAQQHAFLYSSGSLIDLSPGDLVNGWARAINNAGQVVGFVAGPQATYAFTYRDGQTFNIGDLIPGQFGSYASAINNSGTIAGYTSFQNTNYFPFTYRDGQVKELAGLSGYLTGVCGINDAEQVIGFLSVQPGKHRAFLYGNDRITDLSPVVGEQSQALGINNKGEVIGFGSRSNGTRRAFLFQDGKLVELGDVGGLAEGINDAGEIVGQATNNKNLPFAFLWTQKTGILDLNSCVDNLCDGTAPGFTQIFDAKGINKWGNIAASGNYFDGHKTVQSACLLVRI